ncbi:SDR family NAD(P)-dependent oxidoreductase, partial [Nocardia farcinica]|uniref:SDR family NAD(P)-dependent oxidoreductase n=1 Tax=Nocardia farcinica TaxID=37329 RepID=UPI002453F269
MSRYPAIDVRGALVAVTGAGRGIGAATARAFVEAGAHVALGDLDADPAAATPARHGPLARAPPLHLTHKMTYTPIHPHPPSPT